MKRIYDESYLSRSPKAMLSRAAVFSIKRRHAVILAIVAALLALFIISCVLTAAGANVGQAVAQSVQEVNGAAGPAPEAPGTYAEAAVLLDVESGRVLYEKNARETLPIASTTKIITALVVREQLDLDDSVKITAEAAAVGERSINLVAGEELTVEQLLYAILVQSANDAAYALAQYTAGSIEAFADMMNKKARALGAENSSFVNPHGLDQAGHYSTAKDMAVLGRQLLKDPVLAEMVKTEEYEIPHPGQPYSRVCVNTNEILDSYPGATGIKTGYTGTAGRCLIASAERDGESLVAAVLNSQNRAADATALFNYGFEKLEVVTLAAAGSRLGRTMVSAFPRRYVRAVPAEEVKAVSIRGAGDVFQLRTAVVKQASGSVNKGDVLGRIEYSLNNEPAGSGRVIASRSASRPGLFKSAAVFLWYTLCMMGRILSAPLRIF